MPFSSNPAPPFLRRREPRNPKMLPALLSVPKVVLRLLVEPTFGGGAKGNGKTDRHLRANPGTAIQNGRKSLTAYSQSFCGVRNGNAEWLKAKDLDDLSRMRRVMHTHRDSSHRYGPRALARTLTSSSRLSNSEVARAARASGDSFSASSKSLLGSGFMLRILLCDQPLAPAI